MRHRFQIYYRGKLVAVVWSRETADAVLRLLPEV